MITTLSSAASRIACVRRTESSAAAASAAPEFRLFATACTRSSRTRAASTPDCGTPFEVARYDRRIVNAERERLSWAEFGDGATSSRAGRWRRLRARPRPLDRPRGPPGRSCPRLRARREEHVDDERRVLHGRRRAPRRPDDPPAGAGARRPRVVADAHRGRRRRHRARRSALVKEFCAGKVAEVRCAVLYEKSPSRS